ncbi:geranylgeranylglyceryl/heptaprenylglyceryl phosphate synthase [Sulfuracidifex metallicus]|uniref:geranylgeranylglyceryl/heptaprenylglyceryl phosphate synthase n=1 Tax=Sulfuracidifex metallicus TaxID=47303 RepID=UPI0023F52186|nr:geranylgeranylglyceryl/heptaprenylglyceryl phosphate synthase [Sulfuracidifex metallicus]
MKMKGRVRNYINKVLEEGRPLHFSLIDPDKLSSLKDLSMLSKQLYEAGTDAFLIGGTLGISKIELETCLDILEDFPIPKILFPGNVNVVSEKADAILFISLLNSDDIYYVIGAQVLGAPIIKKIRLETLPTAYLIVGYGGTAGHIGRARLIPFDNYELASAYVMAAEFMGMEFAYLEAGSGSPETIRPEMISAIKKISNIKLIVGGGIKTEDKATKIAEAGADIIVTGNIIESNIENATKIIRQIKKTRIIE